MAPSPVAVLAVIAIYLAMFAVLEGASSVDSDLDQDPDVATSGFGGVDILGDIIEAIISVVVLIFNGLTFNVDGAPFYIQFPIAVIIIGSLTWSAVTLIRGN